MTQSSCFYKLLNAGVKVGRNELSRLAGEEFFLRTGKWREAVHLITNEYSSVVKSPRLGTVS